jgi:hypothetical protein
MNENLYTLLASRFASKPDSVCLELVGGER